MGGCGNNSEFSGDKGCNKPIQLNQSSNAGSSDQKVLLVTLYDRATRKPVDLSAGSGITIVANFPATNTNGYVQKSLGSGIAIVSPGQLGQIQITLEPADVAALVAGLISFTVNFTTPTYPSAAVQFLNSLQVNQPPFPGA